MNANLTLREAATAVQKGDFATAVALCEAALRGAPNHPEALYLLGSALIGQRKAQDAEATLERARAANPKNVLLLQGLAGAYNANGKTDQAIAALREAVGFQPGFAMGHLNLALALTSTGELAEAKQHYEAVLALNPNAPRALVGLAWIAAAEERNEDALSLTERALAIAPDLLSARLVKAEMALRHRRYQDVLEQLALCGIEAATVVEHVSYYYLRAQACEALGRYGEAFQAYRTAGQIQREHFRAQMENAPSAASFATISALREFAEKTDITRWKHPPLEGSAPVFFVGYPRSGTTLLDQVLASHPDIETLEENQNLEEAYEQLVHAPGAFERWADLGADEIGAFRATYWRNVRAALGGSPSRAVFIDKLPLNTVMLPLVHRLFPGAKIIFALRDPRDVVLSCFTQRFRMNPAMYSFLSVETAARHYDAVMGLAEVVRRRFPLRFHDVRYEDLVADFDNTVAALLEFLDLPWSDKVRDYAATAKARSINTPSAPDVRLPLYKSSIQRWRKYTDEPEAAAAFSLLARWAEAFGYEAARNRQSS